MEKEANFPHQKKGEKGNERSQLTYLFRGEAE